jgi:hypothetical protein
VEERLTDRTKTDVDLQNLSFKAECRATTQQGELTIATPAVLFDRKGETQ